MKSVHHPRALVPRHLLTRMGPLALLPILTMSPALVAEETTWTAPPLAEAKDDESDSWDDPFAIQSGDWAFSLGISAEWEPLYPGSDEAEVNIRPRITALYWFTPRFGAGIGSQQAGFLYRPTPRLWLEAGVGYVDGREGEDTDALNGFEDIEDGFGLALAARWYVIGEWEIQLSALQDFESNRSGLQIELETGYEWELTDTIGFGLEAGTLWGDETYQQTWFGVTEKQSLNSGLEQYTITSDLNSVSLGAEVEWEPTRRWEVELEVEYIQLVGDAADSPLVKQGWGVETEIGINFNF